MQENLEHWKWNERKKELETGTGTCSFQDQGDSDIH